MTIPLILSVIFQLFWNLNAKFKISCSCTNVFFYNNVGSMLKTLCIISLGDKPVWHFTEKTAFPFRVTVVGKKTDTKNVLKKVLQDVSSIEVKFCY